VGRGTSELAEYAATDSVPYGARNDKEGSPIGYEAHYVIGSPVIAETDPDGSGDAKPDIFVATSEGAIFAFEYDPLANDKLYPKPGWPLLLPEAPREPSLVQLTRGRFSMVVQCQDGTVHMFDLPSTTSDTLTADWPCYGGDLGNTRSKLVGTPFRSPNHPTLHQGVDRARIALVRPMPARTGQEVVIEATKCEAVVLEVYDVSGRLVREAFRGSVLPGKTALRWDGRRANGTSAPSGIYWYQLRSHGGSDRRRIVLLK
jgi:hypothetical protein